MSVFKRKRAAAETAVEIPVLCRLWEEDGVFNGIAEDLAVAVFGNTYEEASANLAAAIIAHPEALQELSKLDDVIQELRIRERAVSEPAVPSQALQNSLSRRCTEVRLDTICASHCRCDQ